MSFQNYNIADLAQGILDGGISQSDTSFSGRNVENIPSSNFILTIATLDEYGNIDNNEKVHVTSYVSGEFTGVTRGFGGTTAKDWDDGAYLYLTVEVNVIEDMQDEIARLETDKANLSGGNAFSGNQTLIDGDLIMKRHNFKSNGFWGIIEHKISTNGSDVRNYIRGIDSGNTQGDSKWIWKNSSDADTIRLDTNGNSFFNGGNVGIGTTTPGAKLDVNGTIGGNDDVTILDSGMGNNANISYGIGQALTNGQTTFFGHGKDISGNHYGFIETYGGGSPVVLQRNSGNVGIGTTNPTSKLSVVGLPTSAIGLSSGDIWNDGGTLKIV